MDLIPVNGQVLVRILKETEIAMPQALSESDQEGVVIARGEGDDTLPQIIAGTQIRWERYAESDGEFDYKDGKAFLLPASKITAYWKKK